MKHYNAFRSTPDPPGFILLGPCKGRNRAEALVDAASRYGYVSWIIEV